MKYTYLVFALLFTFSCSNEQKSTETQAEPDSTEQEIAQEEEVEVESLSDKLMGTWEFEDTKLGVTQSITYSEDGTYNMKMANMDINGTWELTEDVLITKSRPDAEGQKKTITKLTQDSLCTFWEPKGGTGRQINYVRKAD